MYERFTDRAQKVMQLANQEAQRFKHEYIGTEHILLGLIGEYTGVAANVLNNLGVDLRKVRLEVEKLMQSGPYPATMGRLPQTPRAKKVIDYSMEEARNLNHNHVGTEHILLGLLREHSGTAANVLTYLGVSLESVRRDVCILLGRESIEEAIVNAPANGTIAEIREGLDRAENAESGDVTLTGEPPEEPLTDVLDGVTGGMVEAMDYLIDETKPLHEAIDDVALKDHVSRVLHLTRVHAQAIDRTAQNMYETIRVMRAETTKVRKESVPLDEEYLERSLTCVINHIDLMLDKASTPTTVTNSGFWAKGICHRLTALVQLTTLVEESKTASAECCKPQTTPPAEPQARAMATGLAAVDRAMEPETPTDAITITEHDRCEVVDCTFIGRTQPTPETPIDADKA